VAWYRGSTGPWILALIISLIVFVNFFYPGTVLGDVYEKLNTWTIIAGGTAAAIGIINIMRHAFREAKEKSPGRWPFAVYQLFIMVVLLISGIGEGLLTYTHPATGGFVNPTLSGRSGIASVIRWLNINFYFFGEYAANAISGLWLVTASYRAFKIRSVESTLFLLGSVFLMMKFAPVGGFIWGGFPLIGAWIQNVVYSGMVTALTISLGLGTLIYAFRFYVGQERRAFGVRE
jgi:hypothetical protein